MVTKGPTGQCSWAQPGTEGTFLIEQKGFEQEMDIVSFCVVFFVSLVPILMYREQIRRNRDQD